MPHFPGGVAAPTEGEEVHLKWWAYHFVFSSLPTAPIGVLQDCHILSPCWNSHNTLFLHCLSLKVILWFSSLMAIISRLHVMFIVYLPQDVISGPEVSFWVLEGILLPVIGELVPLESSTDLDSPPVSAKDVSPFRLIFGYQPLLFSEQKEEVNLISAGRALHCGRRSGCPPKTFVSMWNPASWREGLLALSPSPWWVSYLWLPKSICAVSAGSSGRQYLVDREGYGAGRKVVGLL